MPGIKPTMNEYECNSRSKGVRWSLMSGAALSTISLASIWSPALAQAPTPATPPAQPAAAPPAASQPANSTLPEIVVTAQRRSESLQRAAIPVTAVSGAEIAARDVTQPAQLATLVPELKVAPVGGTNSNLYIRGVGTQASNSFAENAVGVNIDGVYIGRPSGLYGLLYDLDRIEVLKGPQGTLYGRNATGGVINIVTQQPKLGFFGGDLGLEYGNYDEKKVDGAVNLPVGDTAALRLSGQWIDRDGYLSDGYNDDREYAVRANFLWKPIDKLKIALSADYSHQGGKGPGDVLEPSGPTDTVTPPISQYIGGSDPRSVAALTARYGPLVSLGLITPPQNNGYLHGNVYGISSTITADLNYGTLTIIPAFRQTNPEFLSYLPGFYAYENEKNAQTSVEARFNSPDDKPFRYILGVYYFNQDQNLVNYFALGKTIGSYLSGDLTAQSKAAFGQATYAVTDKFRLVAGVRYTDEDKGRNVNVGPVAPLNPNAPLSNYASTLNFSNWSYKAGVEWDVAPRSLLYANISTGFKAGGFYTGAGEAAFRPEYLTAYTVGSKNRFFYNRLEVNVEGFYWQYKDQQINYIGPVNLGNGFYGSGGLTANVGQSRMYGVDIDGRFKATADDTFSMNLQYLNSKYTSFTFLQFSGNGAPLSTACPLSAYTALPTQAPGKIFLTDCSGKPAINAPEWSAVLGWDHRFELSGDMDLVFHADTKLESGRYLNIEYLPGEYQKGYNKSDLSLTLEQLSKGWMLSAFVNNIENTVTMNQAIVRPIANPIYAGLDAPRTYGVRLRVKF